MRPILISKEQQSAPRTFGWSLKVGLGTFSSGNILFCAVSYSQILALLHQLHIDQNFTHVLLSNGAGTACLFGEVPYACDNRSLARVYITPHFSNPARYFFQLHSARYGLWCLFLVLVFCMGGSLCCLRRKPVRSICLSFGMDQILEMF